jgi:hypothetical protein
MRTMLSPAQARKTLINVRAGVGWSAILAPRLLGRVFGLDTDAQRAMVYFARLFGVRQLIISYQLYQAQTPSSTADEMEEAIRQGILVDGCDLLSATVAGLRHDIPVRTSVMGASAAAFATILGFMGRDREGPGRGKAA